MSVADPPKGERTNGDHANIDRTDDEIANDPNVLVDEPYLWDRSEPAANEQARGKPDVKSLESLLAPLAHRSVDVPYPPATAADRVGRSGDSMAPSPTDLAQRRISPHPTSGGRTFVLAVAATFALAAGAVGYVVGQRSVASKPDLAQQVGPIETGQATSKSATPAPSEPLAMSHPCSRTSSEEGSFSYEALSGQATCDGAVGPTRGYLPLGAWLETDASSRVMLDVADIGHVEISPRTRLRILPGKGNEHRLELARGTLHARIDAPPRLFVVETSAGTAVDLGCVYTLEVGDDGVGLLRVGRGEVALARAGAEVVVHRGEVCEMRPGKGPGTPFPSDATAPFRAAVSAWNFDGAPLDTVLRDAVRGDALGLLALLEKASSSDRARVVARLAELRPPPPSITTEKLLRADADTVAAYRKAIAATP